MFDVNWGRSFIIGPQRFSIEGYIEYINSRHNELGLPVQHWILAQPHLRWDLGHAFFNQSDQLLSVLNISGGKISWEMMMMSIAFRHCLLGSFIVPGFFI